MRILILLFLALTLPGNLRAAFASTTEWDVRTTGATDNGGGFNTAASGTDRSQSDAAYITYADLVIGATTTQATSAAFPFDATSPGNIVNVTSGAGCTVQRAQIVSVAGVVATFDKSLGTAASTCAGKLGGGLTTVADAVGLAVLGNAVHIKTGTYTFTAFQAVSSGVPSFFRGYGTTHNDKGTRPLITTATNSISLFQMTTTATVFDNISFSSTAGVRFPAFNSINDNTQLTVIRCLFDGFSAAIYSTANTKPLIVVDSEIKNSTVNAILMSGQLFIYGSYIHDNAIGVESSLNSDTQISVSVTRSIIAANTSHGIVSTTNGSVLVNESVVSNNGGAGVSMTAPLRFIANNSIFSGNTTYGVTATAAPPSQSLYNNAYGNNTSGNLNNVSAGTGDVTLTVSPFVSATNFALNSTAGGGAALKQLGFPGVFPGGTTTGYLDIGAVQTAAGAAAATIAYPMVQ